MQGIYHGSCLFLLAAPHVNKLTPRVPTLMINGDMTNCAGVSDKWVKWLNAFAMLDLVPTGLEKVHP